MSKSRPKDSDALAVARHALSVAQMARRVPEKKFYQFSSQTTNYLTAVTTVIATPAQGAGGAQRVGDKLLAHRLRVRGKFYSLTPSDVTWRIALVRSVGGGVPAITDVFNTDDTQSQRNRSLDDIYVVVKEQTLTQNATFLNGDMAVQLDWDLGLGPLPIWFTSGAAAYERNGLYLMVQCDIADAASSITKPAIGETGSIWRTELVYTDE